MNSKSFTFVILLMFCLYSRVNSAIISIDSHCWHESGDLEPKITNVVWLPDSKLQVTVQSPTRDGSYDPTCEFGPTAIGHFTFNDHNGHSHRFSHAARFINGYDYQNTYCGENPGRKNPFDYVVSYDPKDTPTKGATVTIALSIYYECFGNLMSEVARCNSCDVKFDSVF